MEEKGDDRRERCVCCQVREHSWLEVVLSPGLKTQAQGCEDARLQGWQGCCDDC